ncbi:hypothetical protein [Nocardia salmonicida]|uniref:hypothetical protein n=1 Tax=Nocardia salmonicida TaxID=53431 RepID=UPI00340AD405
MSTTIRPSASAKGFEQFGAEDRGDAADGHCLAALLQGGERLCGAGRGKADGDTPGTGSGHLGYGGREVGGIAGNGSARDLLATFALEARLDVVDQEIRAVQEPWTLFSVYAVLETTD